VFPWRFVVVAQIDDGYRSHEAVRLLVDESAQDRIVTRIAIQQLPTGKGDVRAFLCMRLRNFAKRDDRQIGRAWRARQFMQREASWCATVRAR
jgi:hypothetical protein